MIFFNERFYIAYCIHLSKTHIRFRDVDTEKVLVSKKLSFGEKIYKYFIVYFYNDHQVKPLLIMIPKTHAYVKSHNGLTKWIYFLIKDDELLAKYNIILDKFIADLKKEFLMTTKLYF